MTLKKAMTSACKESDRARARSAMRWLGRQGYTVLAPGPCCSGCSMAEIARLDEEAGLKDTEDLPYVYWHGQGDDGAFTGDSGAIRRRDQTTMVAPLFLHYGGKYDVDLVRTAFESRGFWLVWPEPKRGRRQDDQTMMVVPKRWSRRNMKLRKLVSLWGSPAYLREWDLLAGRKKRTS